MAFEGSIKNKKIHPHNISLDAHKYACLENTKTSSFTHVKQVCQWILWDDSWVSGCNWMAVLLGIESDECDGCAGQAGSLWQVSSVSWGRIEALSPPPCRAALWLHMSTDWQELLTAFQIHSTTSVKTAVRYQSLTIDMLSVLGVDAVETEISVFASPVFCASVTPESFSWTHTSEPHNKCGRLRRLKG